MPDAVAGAGQTVIGRVSIAPRAKGSSRRGLQVELTVPERHGSGLAPVFNGRSEHAHRQH